jgi:protein AaeX
MFSELNFFGVLFSPFVAMMALAWLITIPLIMLGNRIGLSRVVWHPALFSLAIYVIVLSLTVLTMGAGS